MLRSRAALRWCFVQCGIVAIKDIENARDLLQKNNGTLMEPDRNSSTVGHSFRNSFVFIEFGAEGES
jgi:hypothetical protein